MKNILRLLIILFVFVVFTNCETENFLDLQNEKITVLQNNFTLDLFDDSSELLKNNISINWDRYDTAILNDKQYYEFEVQQKQTYTFSAEGIHSKIVYTLIGYFEEDKPTYMLIKGIPYAENEQETFAYLDTNEYDGMIYVYNLEGTITLVEAYKKGELVQQIENTDVLQLDHLKLDQGCVQDKSFNTGLTTKSDCNLDGGCGTEPVVTTTYMEYYDVTFDNATGNILSVTYSHTEYIGQTTEYVYSCSGTGGTATRVTRASIGDQVDEELLEELLKILNNLTGKAKCVFAKLLMQNGNLFESTIGKFIDDPEYDLILNSEGDCNSESDDACTNAKDLINGRIAINIRNEGRGSLDLAALILHEGIHAEIYRYVDRHYNGIDPQDRSNLLGYYFQYQSDNGSNLATINAQHQHMADNFVKPIAEAIRALDNNRYSLEDYMGFGWDGLRKYGWDGYYDNGQYINLARSESSAYYITQQKVLDNTAFNNDCNQ